VDNALLEILQYYKNTNAAGDQTALVSMLKEIQNYFGNGIPSWVLEQIADELNVKESYLQAIIKRIPSLHFSDFHCLELCAGPNCGKYKNLHLFAEKQAKTCSGKVVIKYGSCMRICGKGPNLKWDGKLYNKADEHLIRELLESVE